MNTTKQPVVEVLDSIMGSGKSRGVIEWMNTHPNNRYLYVSPMLSEVEERIPTDCESIGFVAPTVSDEYKTKSRHLLRLLKDGANISFTHSLFEDLTQEHLQLIKDKEYILIVDEEVDMVSQYQGIYSENDILSLEKSGLIRVDEEDMGRIVWTWDDMLEDTRYSRLRRMADLGMLYCAKNRSMMVTQLPIALLTSAKRNIILTYMFDKSLMDLFLKMKGVKVIPFTDFTPMYSNEEVIERVMDKISILSTPTLDKWKRNNNKEFRLSYYWYSTTAPKEQLQEVGKAIRSIVKNVKSGGKPYMFTMPKDNTEKMKGSRSNNKYALNRWVDISNYIHPAMRATNKYADRKVCIHLYNRHINLAVKAYLADYGTETPDDDRYALSELIQWIWRSNIRKEDTEGIEIYFGSKRMENLFENYLKSMQTTPSNK